MLRAVLLGVVLVLAGCGEGDDFGLDPSERPPSTRPVSGSVSTVEVTSTTAEAVITFTEFEALASGMSLAEVEAVIGGPGTLISSSEFGGFSSEIYEWSGEPQFSLATVVFDDGGLSAKSQFGLD